MEQVNFYGSTLTAHVVRVEQRDDIDYGTVCHNQMVYRVAKHRICTTWQVVGRVEACRTYVWVEEKDDEVIFYAHDSHALSALLEELVQGHYHYSCFLGAIHPNTITVFRNQGESLEAMDRENNIGTFIENYRTFNCSNVIKSLPTLKASEAEGEE